MTAGRPDDRAPGRTRAFTLVEVLVSLMIFSIVGTAFATMLFTASEVLRQGESARVAADEGSTLIAAIEDDLARMVPVRTTTDIDTSLPPTHPDYNKPKQMIATDSGYIQTVANGAVWIIERPDRSQIATFTGGGALVGSSNRQLVVWWLHQNDPNEPLSGEVRRAAIDYPDDDAGQEAAETNAANLMAGSGGEVVASGCLHLSFTPLLRSDAAAFAADPAQWPTRTAWDSDADPLDPAMSMRVRMLLTGRRFGERGQVIDDRGNEIRIQGVRSLPTRPGSLLRVDKDLVTYEGFAQGTITGVQAFDGSARTAAGRGTPVRSGVPWAIVKALP